jgi:hypothetical protein
VGITARVLKHLGKSQSGESRVILSIIARGIDRLSVGIGLVPCSEVGLIFANIGLVLNPMHSYAIYNDIPEYSKELV